MNGKRTIPTTPIHSLSTADRFWLMFHAMPDKTDDEIINAIKRLTSPAYLPAPDRPISRTHAEALADHQDEARRRGLKLS